MEKQEKTLNIQFCILSAMGIIFIVDGHLNNSYFDIGGLLPYYSFHIPLFAFISGYFYRPGSERDLRNYGKHKFKRLMVPYFLWNLFYGVLAWILRGMGFGFGEPVTLWNLLGEPFLHGYQFILNHAAWFVPTLFLTEMAYGAARRVVRNTPALMSLCFFMGLAGIFVSRPWGTEGLLLTAVKVMFLLPVYGAGSLYRTRLEQKDTLGSPWYFSVILFLALGLAVSGRRLIYAVSGCHDFTGYLLPYITAALGIAFWLRAARILTPALAGSRAVLFLGKNTFGVMMHHMTVFLLIKSCYAWLARGGILFGSFDFAAWKTDFYYCFLPRGMGQFKVFYLLAGILVSLALETGVRTCWEKLWRIESEKTRKNREKIS